MAFAACQACAGALDAGPLPDFAAQFAPEVAVQLAPSLAAKTLSNQTLEVAAIARWAGASGRLHPGEQLDGVG